MATTFQVIVDRVRKEIGETTASYWTDAELLAHIVEGVHDLWGDAIQVNPDHPHFITVDESNVSLAASSSTLTGVPSDVHSVNLIEPRDTTSSSSDRLVQFIPRGLNDRHTIAARSLSAQDPGSGLTIYYTVINNGGPVAAPTIRVAPQVSTAINLRLIYVHTLTATDLEIGDNNPIPGESDGALFAYGMAYARSKETPNRSPDPNWIAIYNSHKRNIMERLVPRQSQEPDYVADAFEGVGTYWSY